MAEWCLTVTGVVKVLMAVQDVAEQGDTAVGLLAVRAVTVTRCVAGVSGTHSKG